MVSMLINGRYELEDLPIGRGGMGEVYLGRDVKLDRAIAVKFIRFPDGSYDQDYIRRFVRESRITARLEHPGVPAVYDVGTHESRPFLVMQRIQGISVADLVAEQGPLPVGWATAIAAQVCAVLAVAHEASLVHRDLKPSNLMLEPDGGVKVLDFGLAVAPDQPDFSRITVTGQPLGTPAYMAPEQIQAALTGPATDLYALGCTLHEMLTGERLFTGSTSYDVMSKQVSHPPAPVRGVRAEIPVELERLLLDLLEKKPEDRPADAHLVYRRLTSFVTELRPLPGVLSPPGDPSPTRMYAAVLSRVFADAPASRTPAPPPPEPKQVSPPPPSAVDRGQVRRARSEARRLAGKARYAQAADVLADAVAATPTAAGDSDAVGLRLDLADALFEGGDYRRAAPVYQALVADLADTGDEDLLLRCRLQEATCHALTGSTGQALRQLDDLLRDQRRIIGDDDPRTIDLRRQIGLLQLGTGESAAAQRTLRELWKDLSELHGPSHPMVRELSDLLAVVRP